MTRTLPKPCRQAMEAGTEVANYRREIHEPDGRSWGPTSLGQRCSSEGTAVQARTGHIWNQPYAWLGGRVGGNTGIQAAGHQHPISVLWPASAWPNGAPTSGADTTAHSGAASTPHCDLHPRTLLRPPCQSLCLVWV